MTETPYLVYYLEDDPVPSNAAYGRFRTKGGKSKTYLQPLFRQWKDGVLDNMRKQHQDPLVTLGNPPYLKLFIIVQWKRDEIFSVKNNMLLKRDLSGHLKLLEDSITDAIGLDDSANFELHLFKVPSPVGRIWIVLSPIYNEDEVLRLPIQEYRLLETIVGLQRGCLESGS